MHIASKVVTLVAGAVVGALLVIACSDDSPGRADAASCDCPPAEPPIMGRITVASLTTEIAANDRGGQGVSCPAGAELLSGSCTTDPPSPIRDVTLKQSGFYGDASSWQCRFKNNETTPVTIKVSARCLTPAP